jgi:hypothetical protein
MGAPRISFWGWRGRKLAYKLGFKPLKTILTQHPAVFRGYKYFVLIFNIS